MKTKSCTWPASFLLAAALTANAATTSGPIIVSETWSNTVYLTGDVTVTPTGRLTILPGTRIQADPRSDDQIGGIHSSRIELIVDRGTLVAVGSPTNPILFTAAKLGTNAPQAGDWYGVVLNSTNATMQYCIVEYANQGLRFAGGNPTVAQCTFRKNQIYGAYSKIAASMIGCTLAENPTGVFLDYGSLIVSNCFITNNNYIGFEGYGTATFMNTTVSRNGSERYGAAGISLGLGQVTVLECSVNDNWGEGIAIGYGGNGGLMVIESTVSNNGKNGISTENGHVYMTVTNSVIVNNGNSGIDGGSTHLTIAQSIVCNNRGNALWCDDANVANCVINNNGGYGLRFGTVGASGLIGNTIQGNFVGIFCESSRPTEQGIAANDIFDNWQYELRNNGSAALVADGNYWGEPTTTELSNHIVNLTKIYDSRDNSSVGQVVIRNWSGTALHPTPPSIMSHPQSQLVTLGVSVRFDVVAVGSPPLAYQWWKNTTAIEGATDATLLLTNVQASAADNYWVAVSNSLGSTNSTAAILTVDQSALGGVLSLNMYAGIVFSGTVGKTYNVQFLNNLSLSNNWFDWTPLTNFTLPYSPYRFVDWNSPGAMKRYYRAVQLP